METASLYFRGAPRSEDVEPRLDTLTPVSTATWTQSTRPTLVSIDTLRHHSDTASTHSDTLRTNSDSLYAYGVSIGVKRVNA